MSLTFHRRTWGSRRTWPWCRTSWEGRTCQVHLLYWNFVLSEIGGGKRRRERKDAPEYCISPYPVDDVPGNRVDEDLGRRNIQAWSCSTQIPVRKIYTVELSLSTGTNVKIRQLSRASSIYIFCNHVLSNRIPFKTKLFYCIMLAAEVDCIDGVTKAHFPRD